MKRSSRSEELAFGPCSPLSSLAFKCFEICSIVQRSRAALVILTLMRVSNSLIRLFISFNLSDANMHLMHLLWTTAYEK